MTEVPITPNPEAEGAEPTATGPEVAAPGASGAGGTAGIRPGGAEGAGAGHHTYYEGGPGASSEPGGDDEYDHAPDAADDAAEAPAGSDGEPDESEGEALAEEDTMAATLLADLQRLQAEYVNYKRRVDRDREVIRHTAVGSVVEALLPVLDDIHMARQAGDLSDGPFSAIADKLETVLGRYGVERLGEAGQEFDPNVHEALMHVEADLPAEATSTTVVQVLQPGYRIGDRVVRAARVSVADPS